MFENRDGSWMVHSENAYDVTGEHVISVSSSFRAPAIPAFRTAYGLLASIEERWLNR